MFLITVEATFTPDTITSATDAVAAQAGTVRSMSGCTGYTHYRTEDALAIIQKWDTLDAFDAYRQSETFAGLITALKPLMTSPPVTIVAQAVTP